MIKVNKEITIEAINLVKSFGSFIAVNNISFKVYRGEIFGFLGSNGAGKTTAIKLLCGLLNPDSGSVKIGGLEIYKNIESVKKSIGYMSQKFSLYEDLTIKENITFFGGIYGVKSSQLGIKMDDILVRLNMTSSKNKLVKNLPNGLKQKLAFMIAMIHDPTIIFLDEPTGGVDPLARRLFWDHIYEASDSGTTVFVTTHFMDEAEYCDRISIMVEGKIKILDSPKNIKEKFRIKDIGEVMSIFHT